MWCVVQSAEAGGNASPAQGDTTGIGGFKTEFADMEVRIAADIDKQSEAMEEKLDRLMKVAALADCVALKSTSVQQQPSI